MNSIPYGRQNITEEDIAAVVDVLKSDFLTQGPKIKEFEDAFASYIGCEYAIAVANGTAALHLCTMALGVGRGDKIITTPITFVASANCIGYVDGEAVFCDIDAETYLIDIDNVRSLLERAPKEQYKGIISVDFAGRAVNLEAFRKLADEFGLWIIEDACHAPGAYFLDSAGKRQYCGNGQFADLSVFSFHPVKHIACGEGGMITTNNEALYNRIRNLRTHGIQQRPELKLHNDGPWYYEMQELGYNYRLSDMQAALGVSQLKKADKGLQRRYALAARYEAAFKGKKYLKREPAVIPGHAYHLFVIEVEDRDALFKALRDNNILVQVHYIPAHLMPYYSQKGWKRGDLPVAENYYAHCVSLPLYPTLTDEEQTFVLDIIDSFYGS